MRCAKIPYANRSDAEHARRSIRDKERRHALGVYHCPHCRAFHLGRPRPPSVIPVAPHFTNHPSKLLARYRSLTEEP